MCIQVEMLIGIRSRPVVLIAAIVVMLAALLYLALNRNHAVAPTVPVHRVR
jgi:hypothetical protein